MNFAPLKVTAQKPKTNRKTAGQTEQQAPKNDKASTLKEINDLVGAMKDALGGSLAQAWPEMTPGLPVDAFVHSSLAVAEETAANIRTGERQELNDGAAAAENALAKLTKDGPAVKLADLRSPLPTPELDGAYAKLAGDTGGKIDLGTKEEPVTNATATPSQPAKPTEREKLLKELDRTVDKYLDQIGQSMKENFPELY
ncbi:MAG: hypothetical protein MUC35_04745 [Candidatus Margulisbacteria bacterium]|nr:hypothetical protein [Candidatus Margulisiibacteriota bacterium]